MSEAGESYSRACLAGYERAVLETHAGLDQPYGDAPEQILDVFAPRGHYGPLPVLLFIHGGGWSNGSKEWCGHMAAAITKMPAILVSPSYRLFPGVRYPTPVKDCIRALAWIVEHARSLGADPKKIFVGGHSAGGQIAALMALQTDWITEAGLPEDVIRGCVSVSATFNRRMVNPRVGEEFVSPGPLESIQPESPLALEFKRPAPFLITWGGAEDARLSRTARQMAEKLEAAGGHVAMQEFPGRGHFDMHLELGDVEGDSWRMLSEWMRRLV